MNKREFVVAAGAACAGVAWAGSGEPGSTAMPAPVDLADWQAMVGQTFQVFGATPPRSLRLQQVQVHAMDSRTVQFSLGFAASPGAPVAGTQVLRPAGRPATAVCLDTAGNDAAGVPLVRAHFCQLTRAA